MSIGISGPTMTFWKNLEGRFHRENGPAVIHPSGTQKWFVNGKLHREDGPAIIYNSGTQMWFHNGKTHRVDGPAVVYADRINRNWYIHGRHLTLSEWCGHSLVDPETAVFYKMSVNV